MQLNNTALDRDDRHNQIPNSNRLSCNKVNLVELHDGKATFVEDKTTFPRPAIECGTGSEMRQMNTAMKIQQNAERILQ